MSESAFHKALKCRECGREYAIAPIFSCEFCFGPLEVAYDYDAIREATTRDSIAAGPSTLWRYANFLPCDPAYKVDLGDGYTPLIKADRLGKVLGLDNLWLKNDTVNPTWSFKDRVVSVAIARARGQNWRLSRPQLRATIIFGLCQNALYLGLFFVAMQRIEASLDAGHLTYEESALLWKHYEDGLNGYTYLNRTNNVPAADAPAGTPS